MSSFVSPQPEPHTRWLVTPEPLMGAVCIHMGEVGWARLQTRELIGYEKHKDGTTTYVYSAWTEIPVEVPVPTEVFPA